MTSLLRRHLRARHAFLDPLIEAIECGELDITVGIAQCPSLIPQAIERWERTEAHNIEFQKSQLKMVQLLEQHGCDPWVGWNNLNLLSLAYRAHNPLLLLWAARHPRAPGYKLPEFFSAHPHSPLFGVDGRMIEALVDLGAATDVVDDKGNTPLHLARNADQAIALLKAGVNGYALNQEGLDARDCWDGSKVLSEQRREMEAALATCFPMQAEKIIRQFGSQLYKQGGSRIRARLKEAGVDAASAQWQGFGLIEIFVCESLNNIRDEKGDKKDYTGRDGERWRKSFEAALKMVSNPHQLPACLESIQAATELFLGFIQERPRMPHVVSEPIELVEHPASNPTCHPIARRIDHCIDLIERAVNARLLLDGSYVAANLVSLHIGRLSRDEWLCEDGSGESRLFRLLCLATRGLWDDAWARGSHDTHSPLSRLPIDVDMVPEMLARPHGVGMLILAQTRTKTDVLDKLGTRILSHMSEQGMDQFILSHDDPWLRAALRELEKSKQAVLRNLSRDLDMEAQRQDIERQTVPGKGLKRAFRL